MGVRIGLPAENEYAEFHKGYVARVAHETDGAAVLEDQRRTIDRLRALAPEQARYRYATGKWSVKELIGHLSDSERVFSYRLLTIARGDQTPLPGFDEEAYGARSNAGARDFDDLVDELAAVRASTLALVRSLDERVLANRGTVNDWSLTVRGMVFIIPGHFAHHVAVMRERYGLEI